VGAALLVLGGCAAVPGLHEQTAHAPTVAQTGPIAQPGQQTSPGLPTPPEEADWKPFTLPGKRATVYRFSQRDGRRVIEASADGSASMLRRRLNLEPHQSAEVSWSWWVQDTLVGADLADADSTDAPARLMFAFDGDKSRLSPRSRMMFDLARALTGEEPPYATLMYAFATDTPVGSVLRNPRSERIRKIVVDSGAGHTRQWRLHRRKLAEDFKRAFGEEPGRLIGVAVMTDADNTRSTAKAWYGPINFHTGVDPQRP
jgi:Protein of unknown function (DUF3047)